MKNFVILAVVLLVVFIGVVVLQQAKKSDNDDRFFDTEYGRYADLLYLHLSEKRGVEIYDIEINSQKGELTICYKEPDNFPKHAISDTAAMTLAAIAPLLQGTDLEGVIDHVVLLADIGGNQMGVLSITAGDIVAFNSRKITPVQLMNRIKIEITDV